MSIKLILSSRQILDKVFPGTPRGYDPLMVDEYLDVIIRDYQKIEENLLISKNELDSLKKQISELSTDKKNLEIELGKYQSRFADIKSTDSVTPDNLELLKKINRYERFLYNHGFDPNMIK